MRRICTIVILLALLLPGIAAAQELRDFCPDRPGLGTPACTMNRSHAAAELGLLDWTLERRPGSRTTTLLVSDLLFRYGVTERLEAQLGWTAFGQVRARTQGGEVDHSSGTGDVLLALRKNLRNPDGSGLVLALMPYTILPSGGAAIGAGNWGAGVLLPISRELSAGFQLAFTGSIEAAVDEDREGRHLAYGAVVGLDVPVGMAVGATLELSARRDRDPSGAATQWLGAISTAWTLTDALQLDAGANLGLDSTAPDVQLYLGVARRY